MLITQAPGIKANTMGKTRTQTATELASYITIICGVCALCQALPYVFHKSKFV
jgi:hypothetical protein